MQLRDLGRTGIRVSEIGFGGWAIGGPTEASGMPLGWGRTSDEESLGAIRRARELGVTFFDTSDSYGWGRSESLLGIVLSRKRQDVVIATKVGNVRTSAGEFKKDFTKQHIFLAVDGSLKRLRSDYIDVLQLHNPTMEELRREHIQEAMDRLQEIGKIRFWGVSVSTIEEGLEVIKNSWGHVLQVLYNFEVLGKVFRPEQVLKQVDCPHAAATAGSGARKALPPKAGEPHRANGCPDRCGKPRTDPCRIAHG